MRSKLLHLLAALLLTNWTYATPQFEILTTPDAGSFALVEPNHVAGVAVAENDYPAVKIAARLFADDLALASQSHSYCCPNQRDPDRPTLCGDRAADGAGGDRWHARA